MSEPNEQPAGPGFSPRRRRSVRVSASELVRSREFDGSSLPVVLEPAAQDVDLPGWVESHRERLEADLLRHGGILFRGFAVDSVESFRQIAAAFSPHLLDYTERAAPRTAVSSRVYTSTEFPADQCIPLHHEMSYSHNWPTRIWFLCRQPAERGGRTPIADDRVVLPRLDPEVRDELRRRKVMYVRNYGENIDLPWRDAFQTERREDVEEYCRRSGIGWEWLPGDRLRTRQVRQVEVRHPVTGDLLWFNHAHLFHESNLQPEVRRALCDRYAPDELPRNAFYGDGAPLDDEVLEHVRGTYEEAAVRFTWQAGDVLLLDNFLTSHGREPFEGPRQVVVAMSDLYTAPPEAA